MTENSENCKGCGLPVSEGVGHCPHCGALVSAVDPCPRCDATGLEAGSSFCTSCGWRIGSGLDADSARHNRLRAFFGFRVGRLYEPQEDFTTKLQQLRKREEEIRERLREAEQRLLREETATKKPKSVLQERVDELQSLQKTQFIREEELTRENFLKQLRPRLGRRRETLLGWSNVLALVGAVVVAIASALAAYAQYQVAAIVGALTA